MRNKSAGLSLEAQMLRSILFEQKDEQRMPQAVLLVQATETTMRQPKFVSVSYIHTHLDT